MHKSHYFEQVYEVTKNIPYGRVTSYGAIAQYLCLGSARMVGWALKNSSLHYDTIPAHRVVNSQGELSGRHHFNPPSLMQALLESEGIIVVNDRVENFKSLFWHPEALDSEHHFAHTF